jgi:hypothetical protein
VYTLGPIDTDYHHLRMAEGVPDRAVLARNDDPPAGDVAITSEASWHVQTTAPHR